MKQTSYRGMAALCGGVALLAGAAAAMGVFARGDGSFETVTSVRGVTYEMATTGVYAFNAERVVAEGVGWDVFTLLLAVPAMLLVLPLVARGSFRGRLFALGLLAYFFYQYLEYSLAWAFGPLFPLFVLIYGGSLAGLVWLGVSVGRSGVDARFGERFPGRGFALLNVSLAALLSLMWFGRIAQGLSGDLLAAGLRGETTMVVQALDLGLVVPAALFVSVLGWRRGAWGRTLAAVYIVAATAMAAAILGMLISAGLVEGTFEVPPIAMFAVFVSLAALVGGLIYRSALPDAPGPEQRRPAAVVASARP
jgi:hypothetical protein